MSYTELKKLYYKDHDVYAKEYEERFNGEDTIRLHFQIGEKQAFFVETTETLRLALEIMQLDKEVTELSNILPGIAKEQYSKKCLIDEIVLTNKIEGVRSSRKEIGEALDLLQEQSEKKQKHARFFGLVYKYLKLMEKEIIPLETCQDIRNIYDEVCLQEVIEEDPDNAPDGTIFRKGSESIYNEAQKIIHQGVEPESKIIAYMNDALDFLNHSETQSLYKICIFHYMIEYIHPFYDGNGRLGRFILSYCISKILNPLVAYRISETIKENIKSYYHAFITCNDRLNLGDLTPFLIMQMQMIVSAMKELKKSLDQRLIQWQRYMSLIESLPEASNETMSQLYHYLIQAALFSESGIPTEGLKNLLHIKSPTTISKWLHKIPQNMLISQIKNRVKYYELNLSCLDQMLLEKSLQDIE